MNKKRKRRTTMKISIIVLAVLTGGVFGFMNQKNFGKQPRGERLKRIEASPNYRDGKFHNREATPQFTGKDKSSRSFINLIRNTNAHTKPPMEVATVKTDLHSLDSNTNVIVWFGHSSYFIQLDGKRYLIDPVFYTASPVSFIQKPFKGTDSYKPADIPDIDYLIITHDHWDHLDYKTVKELRQRIGKVICPLGVGQHFEHWKFDVNNIIEMDWDEDAQLADGISIHCLTARHFSNRALKPNITLWASYMLVSPSNTIYIAGDGGYGRHFKEIGLRFPNIDLAIMENGQYSENWKYIHLMPELMTQAAKDLNAKRVLTGHHLKFALSQHPWDEPYRNIQQMQADSIAVLNPMIGEVVEL